MRFFYIKHFTYEYNYLFIHTIIFKFIDKIRFIMIEYLSFTKISPYLWLEDNSFIIVSRYYINTFISWLKKFF